MVRFGPSGNDEAFYNEGNKASVQAPAWLRAKGLQLYEYPFGRGVNMSAPTAQAIAEQAKLNDIEISVHAPYFINFASVDEEKANNSVRYILQSAEAVRMLGGNRVVFHPGSPMKLAREEAQSLILKRLKDLTFIMDENGFDDIILCPETMGKKNQMGSLSEVIEMCALDERYIPCIDFGHINAREGGILKTEQDYISIFDSIRDGIGWDRCEHLHVHFSHIQYTAMGEVKHLTFQDTVFGPDFLPLSKVLIDRGREAHILCESAGTQSDDALSMQRMYLEAMKDVR